MLMGCEFVSLLFVLTEDTHINLAKQTLFSPVFSLRVLEGQSGIPMLQPEPPSSSKVRIAQATVRNRVYITTLPVSYWLAPQT